MTLVSFGNPWTEKNKTMADNNNGSAGWLSGLSTLVATAGVAIGNVWEKANLSHLPNAPAQPATSVTAPLPALPASAQQQSGFANTTQQILLYAALAAGGAALLLSMRGKR